MEIHIRQLFGEQNGSEYIKLMQIFLLLHTNFLEYATFLIFETFWHFSSIYHNSEMVRDRSGFLWSFMCLVNLSINPFRLADYVKITLYTKE